MTTPDEPGDLAPPQPREEPESFGFSVKPADKADTGWCVFLPHQCDSWDIVGEDGYHGLDHADAVTTLERFIAEAQTALTALREPRELVWWDPQ